MREIKFRGRSKRTGKLIYGDLITSPNGLLMYIIQKERENSAFMNNLPPEEVDRETVGEYIGLKDKLGKEIYEGDILLERDGKYIKRSQVCFGRFWHVTGDSRDGVDDEGSEAIGYYLKDYYGTNTFPENKGFALWVSKEPNYIDYLEIAGNIYENAELLEDK